MSTGEMSHRAARVWAKADELAAEAQAAARVRALSTHPDVVALRVERVRTQVDRLTWTGIVLGLAFTMTNVQALAAVGVPDWSMAWWAAWLLDPMVSLILVGVLRAEQVLARWQVQTGPWVRAARWTTLAATYAMNTWSAWAVMDFRLILLHSVPPLVVFVAAEAITDLRERLTDAVLAAAGAAPHREQGPEGRPGDSPAALAASPIGSSEETPAAGGQGTGIATPPVASAAVGEILARAPGEQDRGAATVPSSIARARDVRVAELADLLEAGAPVTGEQAGVIFGVSDRTGRRLLDRAKRSGTAIDNAEVPDPPADANDEAAPPTQHPPNRTAVLRPVTRERIGVSA